MLAPPLALIGIVALAVGGRIAGPPPRTGPTASAGVAGITAVVGHGTVDGVSDAASSATLLPRDPQADAPTAGPSFRSDWPAAIAAAGRSITSPRSREEGTDGFMGRLPFGLPGDTPFGIPERHNKFTIDDIARASGPPAKVAWSTLPDERAQWSIDHPSGG